MRLQQYVIYSQIWKSERNMSFFPLQLRNNILFCVPFLQFFNISSVNTLFILPLSACLATFFNVKIKVFS